MSDLETQDTTSMDDTIAQTLADIQSRGVELEDDSSQTQIDEPEKPARTRDEQGKFTKQENEQEQPAEIKEPEEVEKPARKPPSSWKKEAQDVYSKLDPLAQDEIDRREQDFHKGLETYKQKAQFADQFGQVIQPFMQNIQAENAHPLEAVQHFFRLDHTLRHGSPEQKAAVVQEIMQRAGITPEILSQAPQLDPNLTAVQQQVMNLTRELQHRDQLSQQAEADRLNREISNFATGKEHFETVRQDMAALLQSGRAQGLEDAYEMAVWANPITRAALQAQQQESARQQTAKIAQDAKKAASVNVTKRGSLASTSTTPSSMEDTIRAKLRELGMAS